MNKLSRESNSIIYECMIFLHIIQADTWIDGKTANSPREVIWKTSGKTSSFDFFADGEPNGSIGFSVVMIDNHHGQWDDRDVNDLGYYACEHRNGMGFVLN